MDTKHDEVTVAEHVQRAQSQGQTVPEYCDPAPQPSHAGNLLGAAAIERFSGSAC